MPARFGFNFAFGLPTKVVRGGGSGENGGVTPPTHYNVPRNVTVTDIGDGSGVNLNWEAPASLGDPNGYNINVTAVGSETDGVFSAQGTTLLTSSAGPGDYSFSIQTIGDESLASSDFVTVSGSCVGVPMAQPSLSLTDGGNGGQFTLHINYASSQGLAASNLQVNFNGSSLSDADQSAGDSVDVGVANGPGTYQCIVFQRAVDGNHVDGAPSTLNVEILSPAAGITTADNGDGTGVTISWQLGSSGDVPIGFHLSLTTSPAGPREQDLGIVSSTVLGNGDGEYIGSITNMGDGTNTLNSAPAPFDVSGNG